MLAVYSDDEDTSRRIASALPRSVELYRTAGWDEFLVRAPAARCRIVNIQQLTRGPVIGASVARLLRPLILVTARTAENTARAPSLSPVDIVWSGEIEADLWTKVRRASSLGVLERIATGFRLSTRIPAALREALALACTSARPITTVSELGTLIGRDRRTVWRLWRQCTPGHETLRLEDVLHWIILLRATLEKERDLSWHHVARLLDVHENTLARLAQTLAGTTLSALTFQGPFVVRDAFVRTVFGEPGEHTWDILQ
jgi:hypothetical protein